MGWWDWIFGLNAAFSGIETSKLSQFRECANT
jgi:hypothetical protein